MAIGYGVKSDAEHAELLERLIAEQGIGRHGIFLLSGEGTLTPDGFEETSGYVVTAEDRVFFFWTGWIERAKRTAFKFWQPTVAEAAWFDDDEYRAARNAAGLG